MPSLLPTLKKFMTLVGKPFCIRKLKRNQRLRRGVPNVPNPIAKDFLFDIQCGKHLRTDRSVKQINTPETNVKRSYYHILKHNAPAAASATSGAPDHQFLFVAIFSTEI